MVYFLVIPDSEKRILIDKMLYPLNLDESADETDNNILLFFLLAFVFLRSGGHCFHACQYIL
jgi:hypothetical protein